MSRFFSSYASADGFYFSWVHAALQLSVQESAKDQASQGDMSNLLADQSFVSSILSSVLFTLLPLTLLHWHHKNRNNKGLFDKKHGNDWKAIFMRWKKEELFNEMFSIFSSFFMEKFFLPIPQELDSVKKLKK